MLPITQFVCLFARNEYLAAVQTVQWELCKHILCLGSLVLILLKKYAKAMGPTMPVSTLLWNTLGHRFSGPRVYLRIMMYSVQCTLKSFWNFPRIFSCADIIEAIAVVA